MSTPSRRPFRISTDPAEEEAKPWKVVTEDGHTRGPIGITGLKSLWEVGILTSRAKIADATGENWEAINKHPIWDQVKPAGREFELRVAVAAPAPASSPAVDAPVSAERKEAMALHRLKTTEAQSRALAFHQASRALRIVREVLVFLCFATAGDFLASFAGQSGAAARWGIAVAVVGVALAYYAFRTLGVRSGR
jgi:hypothetical protein